MEKVENLNKYLSNLSERIGGPKSEKGLLMGPFLGEIDRCLKEKDYVALQECTDALIHFLPENVSSLSISIKGEIDPTIIRSERDSVIPEEEKEHWGLFELIQYTALSDLSKED